jgi:hypothetical protein
MVSRRKEENKKEEEKSCSIALNLLRPMID